MRNLLFLILITLSNSASADFFVRDGQTLVVQPGGLVFDYNCHSFFVESGGRLVIDTSTVREVKLFSIAAGGTLEIINAGALNIGSWVNNGSVIGVPTLSFNSCSAIHSISGSGDADNDGVTDGAEPCLLNIDPDNDSIHAFIDPDHTCTLIDPNVAPIPVNNPFLILCLILMLAGLGMFFSPLRKGKSS